MWKEVLSSSQDFYDQEDFTVKLDHSKKKLFVTFPYPYMNGRLHLGHAFTISKVEFIARYFRQKGYNVLFPFSFHGSGTPIYSMAKRVFEKDQKAIDNLIKQGIQKEEIKQFENPYHWIKYFSQKAQEDIKKMGLSIDYTRSFTTTKLEPIYDKFVSWYFKILKDKNILQFGKKHVIYSESTKQPCSDHDRTTGEGVKPKLNKCVIKNCILGIYKQNKDTKPKIVIGSRTNYVEIKYLGKKIIISQLVYNNLKHQTNIEFVKIINIKDIKNLNYIDISNLEIVDKSIDFPIIIDSNEYQSMETKIDVYTPESNVISRYGDTCVVSLTDQWFIDYSDENIKNKVKKHIEESTIEVEVKKKLLETLNWIESWPCSRSYGLGTNIPGEKDLIIDSLSDSTIYMALYTVIHILRTISLEFVNDSLFDAIFLNKEYKQPNKDINKKIKDMQEEFNYWYPVDVRVSGKDLIGNHLVMCLITHQTIFGGGLPKLICANGHLMLNGEKMSKGTGNFLTLSESIDKFTPDVVRFTLASGRDGIVDANFSEKDANRIIVTLYDELEKLKNLKLININNKFSITEKCLGSKIKIIYETTIYNYENLKFREVSNSILELINFKNFFIKNFTSIKSFNRLLYFYYNKLIELIGPICPAFTDQIKTNLINKYKDFNKDFIDFFDNEKDYGLYCFIYDSFINFSSSIKNRIDRLKKKKKNIPNTIQITFYQQLTSEEYNFIEAINQNKKLENMNFKRFESYNKKNSKYKNFIDWYGTEKLSQIEIEMYKENLENMLINFKIKEKIKKEGEIFTKSPGSPSFILIN